MMENPVPLENEGEDVEMVDVEATKTTAPENVDTPSHLIVSAENVEDVEMVNAESMEAANLENDDKLELPEGVTIEPPPQVFGVGNEGDPRLIITHIVNINFKSYSGKTVLGPFHKSFTSIIGPNGSGKSNVIDSMLFVFGFRANKIRSPKLSVLIHNSQNHKDATSCTVEVHFEKITDLDDGGYCTVPGSSFFVSRTAKKDNSSQYYINDRRAQFKEVTSFLQNCGIDLNHNRFLILQGEVEQISQMQPKALTSHDEGMLEYLEDIIGSSRFKGAIEKMNSKIDELNEDRKDKLARVKIVEKDKDELEEVKNNAIAYLNKKNDKISLLNEMYQFYIHDLTKEINKNDEDVKEMKNGMKSFEDNIKVIEEDKKAKNKECAKISKELEKIAARHIEKKDEMRELENKNVKVFEDKKHQKMQTKQLKKKLEKEKTKLSELEFAPETMETEMEELNVRKEEVAQEKKDAEKALNNAMLNLKEETQTLQEEKEELEKILLEKMKYVNESKSKKDMAETELNLFNEKLNSAKHNVERCETQIANSTEARQNAADKLANITSEYPALKMQHSEVTQKLSSLRKKESYLKNQLHDNQTTLSEAKQSAQQNKSQGSVLKFLMDLKRSRNVDGIYGRLGDLGVIDERYDVAISSCCGALENIVVDNILTAEKCIKALKQNDVGQATFVALDMMERHHQAAQKQNTPLDRLVDLISVKEERFRVAFYHALRDTLVAKNLEIATKVAYSKQKRWKVVTLKGEVVDTSGTMTGGGSRVMRGRMSANYKTPEISHEDLTKLQSVCTEFEVELKQVEEEIQQLETQLNSLAEQLEQISSERQLLEQEIRCQEITLRDCKQRLPQLEKALKEAKPDPVQVRLLSDKLDAANKEYEAGSAKTKNIETKKDNIHAKICEINEKKLKPYKTHLENLKKVLNQTLKRIPKLKVAMATSKRNFEKCKTNIEMFESELKENAELIAKLEEEWKVLEIVGAKVFQASEETKEEELKCCQELEEMQTEVKRVTQKHSKELEAFAVQRKDLLAVQDATDKHKVNVEDWKDKLSRLKFYEVDGNQTKELAVLTQEELEVANFIHINEERITVIDEEIDQMNPNMRAIEEYREKEKIYLNRVSELDAVTEQRNKYRNLYNTLRKTRLQEFTEGFTVITNKLKEIYQMITLGGDAELEFVDSLDPFSEGIVFSVRPPKKSWKSICNLSGGEKTLSSLALVFALHHYRPTPLYVMDEIDAALDSKNVAIIARYIVERTKNAQFIIVTLRNQMFEVADRLVGIYKTDNCTKSTTIEPKLIISEATEE